MSNRHVQHVEHDEHKFSCKLVARQVLCPAPRFPAHKILGHCIKASETLAKDTDALVYSTTLSFPSVLCACLNFSVGMDLTQEDLAGYTFDVIDL